MTIYAAADGSALGNPGPAGWGWYVDDDRWAAGGWPHGTNNMGELKAVLDLLEQTAGSGEDLHVYCDSQYVINSVTKWMAGWKRNGWRKKDKSPVLNVELMQAIDAAMEDAALAGRQVRFEWVKGHAGHDLNEKADGLANAAAAAFRDGAKPDAGPGWQDAPAMASAPGEAATTPLTDAMATDTEQPTHQPAQPLAGEALTEVAELETGMTALTASRLGVLLHPDWVRVTAAGAVQRRDEVLAASRPRSRPTVEVSETVPLGPDAVLVRSVQSLGGRRALCTSVWVRDGGDWRQRFTQYTSAG